MKGRAGARAWLAATVFWLLASASWPAAARTVLDLDPQRQPVALLDWGDTWLDETGRATPQTVASDGSIPWRATLPGAIHALKPDRALWIRFVVPPAPDAERWYLEVPYPSVNRVTLYTPDSLGQWQPLVAGDSVPVADWPVPHRHPLMPIAVSAEEPRKYLLRVENGHTFSAPLSFVSESYLLRKEQRTALILGMYFGLAALAAIIAALSAVPLRDGAYGWYSLTVTLLGLTQASLTGVAALHLWPTSPWWSDVAAFTLPVLGVGALQGFLASAVSLQERSRSLYRFKMVLGAMSLVVAGAVILGDPSMRVKLMLAYVMAGTVGGISIVVWGAWRGDRYAKWLLAGILPVLAGAVPPIARAAGLVPTSFWTMHSMQIGLAVELPVLLLVLMLRSQHRREHRRRVMKLERIDPATGLINAQVFEERLEQMMARSVRLRLRCAVLVIDIANIAQIRRRYDRRAAEELPLLVAGRLLSAAREIDSVARLSGHRFGMLIEGPLTAAEVAEAAPRVVARCLMPFKDKPLDFVAQVRIAQGLVPMDGTSPEELMARLEQVLARVPSDEKRAVFALSRPAAPPAPPASVPPTPTAPPAPAPASVRPA
jgi:diguanylate cyclase (GGDEF)-like protein